METPTVNIKYFILFALLFLATRIHAAFYLEWNAFSTQEQVQPTRVFKTNYITQQSGQDVYYYTALDLPQNLIDFGINLVGSPIQAHGANLVNLLFEAMTQNRVRNSSLDMTADQTIASQVEEEAISFEEFPLHWLSGFPTNVERIVFDEIRHINQDITYMTLRIISDEPYWEHISGSQSEDSGVGQFEEDEGAVNVAFQNDDEENGADHEVVQDQNNDNEVNPEAHNEAIRSQRLSVLGVIFQEYTKEQLQQLLQQLRESQQQQIDQLQQQQPLQEDELRRLQRELRRLKKMDISDLPPYRLVVIPRELDNNLVDAVLNNAQTDERRVHFEAHFDRNTLISMRRQLPPIAEPQQNLPQPEASPEERSYFRVFLQYVLAHCLCCCMASGTYRGSSR